MEAINQHSQSWTSAKAYTMGVISLILGLAIGYLMRSPSDGRTAFSGAATAQRGAPTQGKTTMPSADDMKRMAEKQVAPLLAELQKHPKDADLLSKIGQSYLAAQQFQSAQPYLEQSVALKANPDTMNALSFVYYSTGNVDKAIETLNGALKIEPKNPKILFNLGMFEWHGKTDPKAAIAAWQTFVKTNPSDPKRPQVEKLIAQAKQHLNLPPGVKSDKPSM
jgi:Cytochrome c biogenesis factor